MFWKKKNIDRKGISMGTSGVIEALKKVKRKIPLIQVPCQAIYIARRYGWEMCFDYLFPRKPRAIQKMELPPLTEDIFFSIVVPLYNTEETCLSELLESVQGQIYSNWELCLVDAGDQGTGRVREICESYAAADDRIKYIPLPENKGISRNTDYGIAQTGGKYIVLCDHDDILLPKALYMIADAIHESGAEVYYSDEDHIDSKGKHVMPLYKPDWSRDLLYSQMYTCHLFCFTREIYRRVGGFDPEMDGAQDYDLMLRFSEVTDEIRHIPFVLYSWRLTETSTAGNADAKPYAHTAGLKALNRHLQKQYGDRAAAVDSEYPFVYRTSFSMPDEPVRISIIMPMKDHWEMTSQCIDSIREKSTYTNYEIIVLDNRSEEKETFAWFEKITKEFDQVRVVSADFEFNWSKLNNFGMKYATGDVFIFMNNDMLVISPDWMETLAANALRDDIGVVGPLLLYEDNTIQHAGIIVGMGGWADHIYKGTKLSHTGSPFVSPVVNRNVTAVTGACMAVSRKNIMKIGEFDEQFIICGSDVELCIRAYAKGFRNLYTPYVRLYHLESKSRDSYIPEIDFKMSYNCYTPFREDGDPYYNINLDTHRVVPRERRDKMDYQLIKKRLKSNRLTAGAYERLRAAVNRTSTNYDVVEVQPIVPRRLEGYEKRRFNLLVPSLNTEHVFGGIATALKFYKELGKRLDCDLRVILVDAELKQDAMVEMEGFQVVSHQSDDSTAGKQIVSFANRYGETLPVGKNDIFMATGWWTAYTVFPVIRWQTEQYGGEGHSLVYFIQDYEPGFYAWSSRYLMADSTYQSEIPTIGIFNSKLLYEFFEKNGYQFYQKHYFEPVLNDVLKEELLKHQDSYTRKNQILIYGRPGTQRNAFELLLASLNEWTEQFPQAGEWTVLSAGESFADITLKNGQTVHAVGKVSLQEYARLMLESKIGISLMVSPHPSYPPLEMSAFGMKVITNRYGNKDLSMFHQNILSLDNCSATSVARQLSALCGDQDMKNEPVLSGAYFNGENGWDEIMEKVKKEII